MVSPQVKNKIMAVVKKNIADANAYYNLNMPIPEITFNLSGCCAGQAFTQKWLIKINPYLLDQYEDEMINVTVPHEVAHLVDYKVNPQNFMSRHHTGRKRSLHGPTFKFILGNVLGCKDTSTTHKMDTSNAGSRKTTQYVWISKQDGSEMKLGPRRHKKMLSGTSRYWPRGKSNHTFEFSHIDGMKQNKKYMSPQPTTPFPDPKNDPWTILSPTDNQYQVAAQNDKNAVSSHINPTGGTKKERAKVIFASGTSRKQFITQCVSTIGMTKAVASTCYSNFKSGKWK